MAFQWLGRAKSFVSNVTKVLTERNPQVVPTSSSVYAAPDIPPAPPRNWVRTFIDALPLIMLSCGLILTVCAELIRLWAVLGFLLVCTSPIVYWLMRIDQRLTDILRHMERNPERW